MGRIFCLRAAAVVAALVVASFISIPSFPHGGLLSFTPPVSVDRTLKGDRLPLSAPGDKTEIRLPAMPLRTRIPIGCDRAFSPISSPRLANVFRRCAA